MALELQALVTLLSGYPSSRSCISLGIVPLSVLHLLRCCVPECRVMSSWVLCLWVSHLLGYQAFGCCASLGTVSPGFMHLGVMPP